MYNWPSYGAVVNAVCWVWESLDFSMPCEWRFPSVEWSVMHISMMQNLAGLTRVKAFRRNAQPAPATELFKGDWGLCPNKQKCRVCTTLHCLPVLLPLVSIVFRARKNGEHSRILRFLNFNCPVDCSFDNRQIFFRAELQLVACSLTLFSFLPE